MEPKRISPSKINPTKLLGGSSFAKKTTNISEKLKEDSITISVSDLSTIKGQVFEIKNLVTNLTILKKKKLTTERKETEREKFGEREKELEKKKKPEDNKIKLPQAPKLGFLDIVKRFVVNTLIGFVVVRLIKHLPKLIEVAKFVGGAMDFITDVGGKLLNGLATFVQKGYEAYDFTRKTLKSFGGDNALKLFDGFNDALSGIITAALAASFALFDMAGGDSRDAPGRPGRPGRGDGSYKYDPKRALIRKRYGDSAARIYDLEKAKGKNAKQITDIIESRYIKKGRIMPQRMTGSLGGTDVGSRVLGRGIQRAPQRLAIKGLTATLGKGGAKTVLKFVKPLVSKIPIIGGLIEFGLSWALGEPVGKAAFRGIGSVLLGAIGTAIGGPVGAFIGAAAGGEVGGALYDLFFANKKPTEQKVAKASGGGQPVTRGGRLVSGPRRTITKSKVKRQIAVQPTQLKPGADIGGEEKIEKVFPKSKDKNQVSPLDYIEKSYKNTSQDKFFGSLLNLQTKSLVGQKPSKVDYMNAAQGLSNWMTMTFSDEILRTGAVYAAGGGEINADMLSKKSGDMTDAIAKSLEDSISKRLDDNINDLMKQMMLRKEIIEVDDKDKEVTPTEYDEDGEFSTNAGDYKQLLDLIAGVESTSYGGYNAFNRGGSAGGTVAHGSGNATSVSVGGTVKPLTQRTVKEIMDLQSKGELHATGRYQIIRGTLRGLMNGNYGDTGVKLTDLYDASTQDKLGIALIKYRLKTGANPTNFRNEWIGLKYVSDSKLQDAISKAQRGRIYSTPGKINLGTGRVGAVDQFTPIAKRFGLQVTSAYRAGDPGYHGKNMARDYQTKGAPGNSGTPGQMQFAQYLVKNYGSSLKQLIYTPLGFGISNGRKVGLDTWGSATNAIHYDHVHVAFFHGGFVPKDGLYRLHKDEFVVDADSVDLVGKDFIATINDIENKSQLNQKVGSLISHLSYITGYEPGGQQEVVVEMPEPEVVTMPMPIPVGGGGMVMLGSGSGEDYSQELYSHA